MKIFCVVSILISLCLYLQSCTYSITMVHTEGTASDVVDETATNTPEVSAPISLPSALG